MKLNYPRMRWLYKRKWQNVCYILSWYRWWQLYQLRCGRKDEVDGSSVQRAVDLQYFPFWARECSGNQESASVYYISITWLTKMVTEALSYVVRMDVQVISYISSRATEPVPLRRDTEVWGRICNQYTSDVIWRNESSHRKHCFWTIHRHLFFLLPSLRLSRLRRFYNICVLQ